MIGHVLRRYGLLSILLSISVLGLSCSGGGGTGSTDVLAGGGIGGTGYDAGVISKFGSIFVNGLEIQTSGAAITLDGNAASEDALKLGMVVAVTGDVNAGGQFFSGIAISYQSTLVGVVESVNVNTQIIKTMEQNVLVDDYTVFEGTELNILTAGNVIEVSGYRDSVKDIRAMYIKLSQVSYSNGDEIHLIGDVSNLNIAEMRFKIGTLQVDYASAGFTGMTSADLADAIRVRITAEQALSGNRLAVSMISMVQVGVPAGDGAKVDLEGYVTSVVSADTFVIDGQTVTVDSGTLYVHGGATSIVVNAMISVKGIMNNDVLEAEKVTFHKSANVKLEGVVDTVGLTSITVMGINVTVSDHAQIKDLTDPSNKYFSLDDIAPGDKVRIVGAADDSGNVIAGLLHRKLSDGQMLVKGPVASIAEPDLTVLGIGILTDGTTVFLNSAETAITSAVFFNAVNVDSSVQAKGIATSGSSMTALEIILEE